MSEPLKASSAKVQAHLAQFDTPFQVQELPASTRSAQEAADTLGCEVAQIAKSLIFRDLVSDEAVLIIASGANQVDLAKVAAQTGLQLGKADAAFVRNKVGYAIGGVPPVAHTSKLRTFLDPSLQAFTVIWAAAGTPNAVFALTAQDLAKITQGQWLDLAK
ncbi:YbaK/EbsC family protein [Pseudoalteromonas fenneropenaei]|uniref:YbaK/EbsC family protein n=1 Tax=Pseudoalteromonas fenneropenaei TaxID=1737459 RepID=A0ABV7CI37_9GAMM